MGIRFRIGWAVWPMILLPIAAAPTLWTWRAPALAPVTGPAAVADVATPGELVVDLRDDVTPGQVADLERHYGFQLRDNSPPGRTGHLMRATVTPGSEQAVLDPLAREPAVEAAAQERQVAAFWRPNDPRYAEQWNLRMIGMEQAWEKTRGKGVIVAVIDTGVAFERDSKCYRARDFARTRFVRGYDFVNRDDHPNDDNGHGTHVAGTIAESTDNGEGVAGIAFEAAIMPLKVLSATGTGSNADVADAIRYAADHGARVINLSLGMPFPDPVVHAACRYAYAKGVTIVCAAGNGGSEGVYYPAAFRECIAVSAVGPSDELAPYSSYGRPIALAAPGGDKSGGEAGGVLQNTVQPNRTPHAEQPEATATGGEQPDAASTGGEQPGSTSTDAEQPDAASTDADQPSGAATDSKGPATEEPNPEEPKPNAEDAAPPDTGGMSAIMANAGTLDTPQPESTEPNDGYYFFQGTSMAAPHVAGAAALIISRGVTDPAQVRAVLRGSARRRGPAERYGAGRLDAARAVSQAGAARSDTLAKLALGLPTALLPLGLMALRRRRGADAGLPVGLMAAVLAGWLVPDALVRWLGYSSPWHLVGHSILLPGLLLVGLGGRRALRLVALFAAAVTLHLLWDLGRGITPHATSPAADIEWPTTLWLVTNAVLGVGITVAALRRAREG
jgi:subtilisin family serine protease